MRLVTDVKRWGTVVLAASLLAACGGQKGAVKGGDTAGTEGKVQIGPEGARPDQISTRAKLKFEDAIKAFNDQEKAGTHDWESLEQRFRAALSEDQNLAEADFNLGMVLEKQGKHAEAEKHYRAAMAKKPSLTMAGHNLAALQHRTGNTVAAAETYRDVLDRAPNDAGSMAGLAELARLSGDCDQALAQARGALVRDPAMLDATKVMMRCYLERKDLPLARLVAQRALKVAPKDPDILMVVGQILLQEGKTDLARSQFKAAAEAQTGYAPAHRMLADLALRDQNWSQAEEQLRKLLQVDGKNAEAHLNLGIAYRGMGQSDKAMQEYDEAEKLNPKLAPVYFNRAVVLQKDKDAPERALELYRKYVSMAGGEFAVAGDSPVYALIAECETAVTQKAEFARMEQMEAAAAAQEAENLKAVEAAAAAAAAGEPGGPAPTAPAAPAAPAAQPVVQDDGSNPFGDEPE